VSERLLHSVVVPAFNESAAIDRTYNEIRHRPLYLVAETKCGAGRVAEDVTGRTAKAEA